MSDFPNSPRVIKGGLVVLAPGGTTIRRVIALQYNPDTLSRSYQIQGVGAEGGNDRAQPFRFKGPAVESIKLDAEIDATDQLEHPDDPANTPVATQGLLPALAVLERLVTPTSRELLDLDALFDRGMLEVAPSEAPLTVLVWGVKRVVPVAVTSLTITEEAFDPSLQPIRVKVSFECKVLTSSDLTLQHLGGNLYIAYRQAVEQLATLVTTSDLRPLGLEHLP